MVEEVTLPASTAHRLAQAAADARHEQEAKGRERVADSLNDAEFELFEAALHGTGGELVSASAELVSTAAAFSESDVEAGMTARAFLENIGYWG